MSAFERGSIICIRKKINENVLDTARMTVSIMT